METFTLQYSYTIMKNLQCEVELKPTSLLIMNKIATYVVYPSEAEAIADTQRLIDEQTPLMYEVLQENEGISSDIKSLFTL